MLDSQFKLGADVSMAIADLGAAARSPAPRPRRSAATSSLRQDRAACSPATLEGSLLSARSDWNRNYYRQEVGPREIVVAMRAHNPGADLLRAVPMRFGTGSGAAAAPAPAGDNPAGLTQGTLTPGNALGSGPVQQSTLPPLR